MAVTIMYKKGNNWVQAEKEKGEYEVNFLISALGSTHDKDRIFYINPEENSISIYKNGKVKKFALTEKHYVVYENKVGDYNPDDHKEVVVRLPQNIIDGSLKGYINDVLDLFR